MALSATDPLLDTSVQQRVRIIQIEDLVAVPESGLGELDTIALARLTLFTEEYIP